MRQWIGSALVQMMACRLFSAKPLSKPMLGFCLLHPQEQSSVKFWSKYKTFHSQKCIWISRLWNGGDFVQGRWVDTKYTPQHGSWDFSLMHCGICGNTLLQLLSYVKRHTDHMASLAVCSGLLLFSDKPLGLPAFVRLAYCLFRKIYVLKHIHMAPL